MYVLYNTFIAVRAIFSQRHNETDMYMYMYIINTFVYNDFSCLMYVFIHVFQYQKYMKYICA